VPPAARGGSRASVAGAIAASTSAATHVRIDLIRRFMGQQHMRISATAHDGADAAALLERAVARLQDG
jgi:hypothetical protein